MTTLHDRAEAQAERDHEAVWAAVACEQCGDDLDSGRVQERGLAFCNQDCLGEYADEAARWDGHRYDDIGPIDGVGFADPGGTSALRAATPENPRNLPCPSCQSPNRLTPIDRARGYQCDQCADRVERGW